jgi:hypothetical protein
LDLELGQRPTLPPGSSYAPPVPGPSPKSRIARRLHSSVSFERASLSIVRRVAEFPAPFGSSTKRCGAPLLHPKKLFLPALRPTCPSACRSTAGGDAPPAAPSNPSPPAGRSQAVWPGLAVGTCASHCLETMSEKATRSGAMPGGGTGMSVSMAAARRAVSPAGVGWARRYSVASKYTIRRNGSHRRMLPCPTGRWLEGREPK